MACMVCWAPCRSCFTVMSRSSPGYGAALGLALGLASVTQLRWNVRDDCHFREMSPPRPGHVPVLSRSCMRSCPGRGRALSRLCVPSASPLPKNTLGRGAVLDPGERAAMYVAPHARLQSPALAHVVCTAAQLHAHECDGVCILALWPCAVLPVCSAMVQSQTVSVPPFHVCTSVHPATTCAEHARRIGPQAQWRLVMRGWRISGVWWV
mmetsp:Transcript_24749/g.57643  ORF Transcript_24749/g.57643 Transcript_24749/m.57643 type:complete len:209 (-) Transcript_24749:297-923(-)